MLLLAGQLSPAVFGFGGAGRVRSQVFGPVEPQLGVVAEVLVVWLVEVSGDGGWSWAVRMAGFGVVEGEGRECGQYFEEIVCCVVELFG